MDSARSMRAMSFRLRRRPGRASALISSSMALPVLSLTRNESWIVSGSSAGGRPKATESIALAFMRTNLNPLDVCVYNYFRKHSPSTNNASTLPLTASLAASSGSSVGSHGRGPVKAFPSAQLPSCDVLRDAARVDKQEQLRDGEQA